MKDLILKAQAGDRDAEYEIIKNNDGLILVTEPFLLDDELREKCLRWVEWANKADPKEYDLLHMDENEGDNNE